MHSDALGSQLSSQDLYHLPTVQGFLSWCRVSFPSEEFPLCLRVISVSLLGGGFSYLSWQLLPSSLWSGVLSFCRVSFHIPIDQSFLSWNICPLRMKSFLPYPIDQGSFPSGEFLIVFHLSGFPWLQVQDFPSFLRVFIHLPIDQGRVVK